MGVLSLFSFNGAFFLIFKLKVLNSCRLLTGWEQPNWFALVGDEAGYKPSFRRTNWFEPVGREVKAVLARVGLIDLTPFGKIEISGRDAIEFVDRVFANVVPPVTKATNPKINDVNSALIAVLVFSVLEVSNLNMSPVKIHENTFVFVVF